jgi:hypothetical protein
VVRIRVPLLWAIALWSGAAGAQASHAGAGALTVTLERTAARRSIDPRIAVGATIDGHDSGTTAAIFRPAVQAGMLEAGLGALSYRLRTELANEAWHWNPRGTWSDAAAAEGYWTSRSEPDAAIITSYGYRLPRRGNTRDQANDDGYSRLTDGDTATFWKTNPYLAPRYTGEPESAHPAWLIVDFATPARVNAMRIVWGEPYARSAEIEYWAGATTESIDRNPDGEWKPFPRGALHAVAGGDETVRLADGAVRTRFIRIRFGASSGTAGAASRDPRDSVGVAVREVYAGTIDAGELRDVIRHGRSARAQTRILVSSTDPWHRALDRDVDVEQPGIDLVATSPVARGLPMMIPAGILYDTPDNAVALLRYVRARGYPLDAIELGEEPDGQFVTPEDEAALYGQAARALRAVDPHVRLGGPSLQGLTNDEMVAWPVRTAPGRRRTWVGRFMDALDAHGDTDALQFLSFEWYPHEDPCAPTAPQLAGNPAMLVRALARMSAGGLPDSIPRIITEYGYSSHSGAAEMGIEAALVDADIVGGFLSAGGARAYLFGYEPGSLLRNDRCGSWGNQLMFIEDDDGGIAHRVATFRSAQLVTKAWLDSAGGPHELLRAHVAPGRARAAALVSAYAVLRPDGRWSVMLINRDPKRTWPVSVRPSGVAAPGAVPRTERWQFGPAQYAWRANGANGRPSRNAPPRHWVESGPGAHDVALPPWSITVLVGGTARPPL